MVKPEILPDLLCTLTTTLYLPGKKVQGGSFSPLFAFVLKIFLKVKETKNLEKHFSHLLMLSHPLKRVLSYVK